MAILNLTPQLAERGKIKIGGLGDERKKQGSDETYRLSEKYDHFIITYVQRDEAGRLIADKELMQKFAKEGGPTISKGPYKGLPLIREITVRLLYDDIELNYPTYYACYHGKVCWCSGNGKTASRMDDAGKRQQVECPCERQDPLYPNKKDKCNIIGTLQVIIDGANRIGGVWKYRSKGWNTVNAILSSLSLLKTITGGPLAGIPLNLVVSPKTAMIPGTGESVLIYMVSIEYLGTGKYPVKQIGVDEEDKEPIYIGGVQQELEEWGCRIAQRRLRNRFRLEHIEEQARKMLVAPHEESPEEQAQTGAEFFPDSMTDLGFKQPPGPDDDSRVRASIVEGSATKEEASKDALKAAATSSEGATSESSAEATSQSQEEEVQKPKPMTIPEVIEACQAQTFIPAFPIPLVTTKGVAIGEWVDRKSDIDGIQVFFEMVPTMTETTGLTQGRISKSFKAAGYRVKFQEPGTMKQALAQEEAVIPPPEQVQAQASNNNGGKSKSLF